MLIERKIIVMKLNSVLLAGLVSIGLLTIGADSAFAGGYFSAGNPGGLQAASGYRLAQRRLTKLGRETMLGPNTRHKLGRSKYRMSQPEPLVRRFNIKPLLRNLQANLNLRSLGPSWYARAPIRVNLSRASAGECILSRRDRMIVARYEVPG